MKICFMGTSPFAYKSLKALIENGYNVSCIYTKKNKPKGRGLKIIPTDIEKLALENNIILEAPISLKTQEEQEKFQGYNFDIAIVASYGLILPKEILISPKMGCINIHGSLLPRWRGAAPIQMSIVSGDKKTGITIMQMNQGLDTGDMLYKKEIDILADTTFTSLYNSLGDLGAQSLIESLPLILEEKLKPQKQQERLATYARQLKKEQGKLDFNENAYDLEKKVRGFNPFPSTYIFYKEEIIKILEVEVIEKDHFFKVGEIIDTNEFLIACGDKEGRNTILKVIKLQRQGKRPLLYSEFKKGFELQKGILL